MNQSDKTKTMAYDEGTWLLEEYKLLSSHYFHEDTLYWKGMGFYSTVNGGLLVFLGSSFVTVETIVQYMIPIIGIILCVSWISSLIRIREYRDYIVHRIKKIEFELHKQWEILDIKPCDIRTFEDWEKLEEQRYNILGLYKVFRNFPSSISLLLLPCSFFISWIAILILKFV